MKRLMLIVVLLSLVCLMAFAETPSQRSSEFCDRYVAAYLPHTKQVTIVKAQFGVPYQLALARAQKMSGFYQPDRGDRYVAGYKKGTKEVVIVKAPYGVSYEQAQKSADNLRAAANAVTPSKNKPPQSKPSKPASSTPSPPAKK